MHTHIQTYVRTKGAAINLECLYLNVYVYSLVAVSKPKIRRSHTYVF